MWKWVWPKQKWVWSRSKWEGLALQFTVDFVVEGKCEKEAGKNSELRPEEVLL